MKKYIHAIKNTMLFKGMAEEDIYSMLDCLSAVKKEYRKGSYIYRAGDEVSKIALILSGSIHIEKEDYWGNNSLLSEVSGGDLIGEVYTCLDGEPIAVNAIAVRDSTVALMDLKKIFTTCSTACPHHARLVQNFIQVIAAKNRELTRKLEHISQRTTRGKLLSYLSEQSRKKGSASFDIPFNRQQLADFLAIDRSAMSKELGKLKQEGVLDFNKNHFILQLVD